MKIKIELDGLTLDQATDLTKFLSSLKEPSENNQYDKEGYLAKVEYPKTVRRPYSTELKVVYSPEEHKEFLNSGEAPTKPDIVEALKEEKPKATRKKAEKVEVPAEVKQLTEDAEEPKKVEAIEVKDAEIVSAPTLMQIRSLVAAKAADNKEAIKAKLVELGAQNVSTLDAKHFQTIFDFLTEL